VMIRTKVKIPISRLIKGQKNVVRGALSTKVLAKAGERPELPPASDDRRNLPIAAN
jgi:hypothetical protein